MFQHDLYFFGGFISLDIPALLSVYPPLENPFPSHSSSYPLSIIVTFVPGILFTVLLRPCVMFSSALQFKDFVGVRDTTKYSTSMHLLRLHTSLERITTIKNRLIHMVLHGSISGGLKGKPFPIAGSNPSGSRVFFSGNILCL